jgi:hypothetical protein
VLGPDWLEAQYEQQKNAAGEKTQPDLPSGLARSGPGSRLPAQARDLLICQRGDHACA